MRLKYFIYIVSFLLALPLMAQQKRVRAYGIEPGILSPGPLNAITDVSGVMVGHHTLIEGDNIRTGVTAILPHGGNLFQQKVPAAIYIGNGFGKLMGYSQVEELGNIETPIVLTNTLSVPAAADALIDYTLGQEENAAVRSVNPVVGETNDGRLNDIRGRRLTKEHVLNAITSAASGPVAEGNVGAGTGTICFGFKGGMGTSSRRLSQEDGGYTVGVLVQTNFGGVLQVDGLPVGEELRKQKATGGSGDGSCMIIVATDALVDARNLKRLAKRAMLGLARTGGIASNGSGDYVIAFSTAEGLRVPYDPPSSLLEQKVLDNSAVTPLFLATIEATEEAILNSLFTAETMTGNGHKVEALPIERVLELMNRAGRKDQKD